MPLYRFQCQTCGQDFEAFLSLSEAQEGVRCPKCGSLQVKKPSQNSSSSLMESCALDKKT